MRPRRLPALLSLVASLALVAACGSASGSGSPGATTAGTQGAGATEAPATQGSGATPGPQASFDFSNATGGLASLTSYKISLQVGGADIETTIINGPVAAKQVTETVGSKVIRAIEIGNDTWLDEGTGTYVKNALPKSAVDAMFGAYDPVMLFSAVQSQPELAYLQNMGTESKNGINAVHFHADQNTQLPAGASAIPAGTVFDMWVAADGGYVVAIEASGLDSSGVSTSELKIEVSNVNDSSLSVTPPA
jgi:hypothetical protein